MARLRDLEVETFLQEAVEIEPALYTRRKGPRHPRTIRARFWDLVEKRGPEECWPWIGCRTKDGYGQFGLRLTNGRWRTVGAYRVAFVLATGKDPGGLHVCHRCDNPPCVNPAHLFLGTSEENMADAQKKRRALWRPDAGRPRGEMHGGARLSRQQVEGLRAVRGLSQRKLAQKFGISQAQVGRILRGESWGV